MGQPIGSLKSLGESPTIFHAEIHAIKKRPVCSTLLRSKQVYLVKLNFLLRTWTVFLDLKWGKNTTRRWMDGEKSPVCDRQNKSQKIRKREEEKRYKGDHKPLTFHLKKTGIAVYRILSDTAQFCQRLKYLEGVSLTFRKILDFYRSQE